MWMTGWNGWPANRGLPPRGYWVLIACATLLCTFAIAQDDVPPPADEPSVYEAPPPDRPLDERVDADRMTVSDPPPLPNMVVLPKPPLYRIADSAEDVPVISEEHFEKARQAIERGVRFLLERQDEDTGLWMHEAQASPSPGAESRQPSPVSVAVTALAVRAVVQAGDAPTRERNEARARAVESIQDALRAIQTMQRDDGSFQGGALTNYVTSSVVSALAAVDDPALREQIGSAVRWLQANQWHQEQGVSPNHDWFGGAGYGNHGRPDLSNTQMMLDALYDAGLSPDEPAFQRAIAFVSRAQNLQATNSSEWAGNDGGFVYTPANGGESFVNEAIGEGRYGKDIPEGQPRSLRSYGSMTYAGFKSMMYAGMSVDDVRVRAAFDWIRNNWTFDENPGLGQQGLYYYYHTMARALVIAQQHEITDVQGGKHNWREEMIDAIVARQQQDGSWSNEAERWLEGEPVMATIYSVLALEEILKPVFVMDEQLPTGRRQNRNLSPPANSPAD